MFFIIRLKLFVDKEVKDYRGSRDIESLIEFVTANTDSVQPTAQTLTEEPSQGEVRVDDNGLAHLTDENFDTYLTSKSGVHFVKFYAPWCVRLQIFYVN